MSMNNVVPGWVLRDPEKAASLMEAMGYSQDEGTPSSVTEPVLPGMEDWAPELDDVDEGEAEYVEDIGERAVIYRIVNNQGEEVRSNHSTALNKPYYATLRGARSAATYMSNRLGIGAKVQKGDVTWREL